MDLVHEHASLRPFLAWITERHARLGGLTEVRILGGPRGVWSAFLGPAHVEDTVEALLPGSPGQHPKIGQANVYFSVNPIAPKSVSGTQRFERVRATTRDRDVRALSMFVVDIDPQRQPRDRAASDAEKAHALAVSEAVRGCLVELGAQPLVADSGNGYHLLVPVVPAFDEDIEQAARDARNLLRWLDVRFSTDEARVDVSMFNPSRICKLYGTMALKGTPTDEHPHRWSSIDLSDIPGDVDLFERARLLVSDLAPPRTGFPLMRRSSPSQWEGWRAKAVAALPIEEVYGAWLTGSSSGTGWLQCRDPASETGDQNPSAGVADGTGPAERGSFHSFRTGHTESVFDFLIRAGHATDFRSAAAIVAELSGVPAPDGARDPWARVRLCPPAERERQVQEAVRTVLASPRHAQKQQLDALREAAHMDSRSMKAVVQTVRSANRQPPELPQTTPRGRPVVEYVANRDTVEDLFVALVDIIRPFARFFRTEREIVFIRRGVGPIVVTDRNVAGLLSALVEVRVMRLTGDGLEFVRYSVLPTDLARAFVASPRVQLKLPPLNLYTRSPLFDAQWAFVGKPGYHEPSGVFYDGPDVEPREGCARLCEALTDFHWKEEADRVNFVGALLTALTMPHWGRGHPFLAVNGNKPGVGKSTLARVLGVLVEGGEPNTVSYAADEAEFEKQLATRIEAGDRVVVIDNAKTQRAIESPVLERCITDTRLNFRRLGSNTAITRPQNDVLFCLTMNLVQLGPDLRRRALPLNLELDANVRQTTYRLGDLVGWVAQHRLELLGELAAMVLAWVEAGKPACEQPARHSTSQDWAQTIDAILRLAGFDGFLTNFEKSEHAFDPRFEQMAEIAREHYERTPTTAALWVPHVETILEDRFRDGRGQPRTARAKATIVGSLFTDYLGTRFEIEGGEWVEVIRRFPEGMSRSPVYGFQVAP
jgi:hypothetical protein